MTEVHREKRRVRAHILGAERLALENRRRLDPVRALNRAILLHELGRYRRAGHFPKNREFPGRLVPYFVDSDGTRCALAHLLEIGGQAELVREIAARSNNARVRELSENAELRAWLNAAGLTLKEAARIQPYYCVETPDNQCFCQQGRSLKTVALGTVLQAENGSLRVRIDRIEGEASLSPGDEVAARGFQSSGQQIVLARWWPIDADATPLFPLAGLRPTDAGIVCENNEFGRLHPVPVDEAFTAMMSNQRECQATLVKLHPGWHEGGTCDGCACSQPVALDGAPAFATLAVLFALISYRRQQRARRRLPDISARPEPAHDGIHRLRR